MIFAPEPTLPHIAIRTVEIAALVTMIDALSRSRSPTT